MKNTKNLIEESKNQISSLKAQLQTKGEENFAFKKEYERILASKDKKIQELSSVINQSVYSYNSGLNNIKIANKLDDEVKVLMKRAKIDDGNESNASKK